MKILKKKLSINNMIPGIRLYQDLDDEYKIYVVQYIDEDNKLLSLYDIETNDDFELLFDDYNNSKDIRVVIPDSGFNVKDLIEGYPYDAEFAIYEYMTEPEIEYFLNGFMDKYLDKEYIDNYVLTSWDKIHDELFKVIKKVSFNLLKGTIPLPKEVDIRPLLKNLDIDKYNIDRKNLAKYRINTILALDKLLSLRSHHISNIEVHEYHHNTIVTNINYDWVMVYNKANDKFYVVLLHDGQSKVKDHLKDNATSDIVKHYMEKRRRKMR